MRTNYTIKHLFRSFTTLPTGVPNSFYRWYVFFNYGSLIAIFLYAIFLLSFFWSGVFSLVIVNTATIIIFSVCIYLNIIGRFVLSITLIIIEVLIDQIACVIYLGWNTGFQNYIFALPMVIYFTPWKAHIIKAIATLFIIVSYILLMFYSQIVEPFFELDKSMRNAFTIANVFGAGFVFAIFASYFNNAASTAEEDLEREHKKSENLLHNILPVSIANRLKDDTSIIADSINSSTTLFADIVGFTIISEKLSPEELVIMLNQIFTQFDNLTEKHGIEKIKTIGDAYMVVAGIPIHREDHAEVIAEMALDMIQTLKVVSNVLGQELNIRVGINSGPVVAGVIGNKKFIYDLWGDSVNTAARMESHGVPGEIQVTEASYVLLKDKYHFDYRGEINIKGKGLMTTYLLKGRKPAHEQT